MADGLLLKDKSIAVDVSFSLLLHFPFDPVSVSRRRYRDHHIVPLNIE